MDSQRDRQPDLLTKNPQPKKKTLEEKLAKNWIFDTKINHFLTSTRRKTVNREMKKPYKCPFCWNRYGYEHSRALHIRDDHKNILQNPSLMKASESLIEYKVGFKSFQKLFFRKLLNFWLCRTLEEIERIRFVYKWPHGSSENMRGNRVQRFGKN